MTIQCSVFVATSLDGFISREDGSIDWLLKINELMPKGEDCGYLAFMATIDMIVMGRHSFEKVLTFNPWPYDNTPVIVLSTEDLTIPSHLTTTVTHSSEPIDKLLHRLEKNNVKRIYIDGGITVQRFLEKKQIHDITITVIPILLGSGRSLFGPLPEDLKLNLVNTRQYDCGLIQLKYDVAY